MDSRWSRRGWVHVTRRVVAPATVFVVVIAGIASLDGAALRIVQAAGVVITISLLSWVAYRQQRQDRKIDALLATLGRDRTTTDQRRPARTVLGQLGIVRRETTALEARITAVDRRVRGLDPKLEKVRMRVAVADRGVTTEMSKLFQQIESTFNLYAQLPVAGLMPAMRGWAISPDLMVVLVEIVRQRRPAVIVELGSGSSTVWLAQAARIFSPETRIISIEHNEAWVRTVAARLDAHGLGGWADVRHAPLCDQQIDGRTSPWYDPAAWKDLVDIGLLLVDGPPKATATEARRPAIPSLTPSLSQDAVIVMDDADRDDEQRIADRWLELLPEYSRLDLRVEKRATVLFRGRPPAL
ncbi:MAG: class I SAM-dependent methyltransferase [Angustibacter sp.]